jgi:hypothetical protein
MMSFVLTGCSDRYRIFSRVSVRALYIDSYKKVPGSEMAKKAYPHD